MVDILSVLFSIQFLTCTVGLAILLLASIKWREQSGEGVVQVVVLGDAGRSPRMQYHCLSLVQLDYTVELVGYGGAPLLRELRESQRLKHHKLSEPPPLFNSLPHILRYLLKALYQTLGLLWTVLISTKKASHVLVQTPPAIPTLAVMIVACSIKGSKLIIDYHNYGYTMLALRLGRSHTLVRVSKQYERLMSGFSFANLCVSEAMKKDLRRTLGIRAVVLYDRPPSRFRPTSLDQKHELFQRLSKSHPALCGNDLSDNLSSTIFTEKSADGDVSLRKGRPFFIVSSTSWTEDEDFGVLLQALEIYNDKCLKASDGMFPKIVCIITGNGPLKEFYEKKILEKKFTHISILTLWLSSEDYPLLLGSADLGVCLHKSSSGLDLPMKVVDMFGSGLPVCAINFNCLHELLRHNHNGLVFNDYTELAQQLLELACGFPDNFTQLSRFRDNLTSFQCLRWNHYWRLHVLPLIALPQ